MTAQLGEARLLAEAFEALQLSLSFPSTVRAQASKKQRLSLAYPMLALLIHITILLS